MYIVFRTASDTLFAHLRSRASGCKGSRPSKFRGTTRKRSMSSPRGESLGSSCVNAARQDADDASILAEATEDHRPAQASAQVKPRPPNKREGKKKRDISS